jgi:hypothetical protein
MTPDNLEIGGRYNWRNQPERLIYMGSRLYPDGLWYQFAKVEAPNVCWSEVRSEDLNSFEATDAPTAGFLKKAARAPAYEAYSAIVIPVGHSYFRKNLAAMRLRKNLETLNKNLHKRIARSLK